MSAGQRAQPGAGALAELVEVCARHADELASQAEGAQLAVTAQLGQLDRAQLDQAAGTACWLGATLRVLASSLGELHTVLDEAAHLARDDQPTPAARPRVPRPRPAEVDRDPQPGRRTVQEVTR